MVLIQTESWANTNLLLEDYAFNLKSQQHMTYDFSFIWQVVFKLETYFAKRGRIPLLSLNEIGEKSQVTRILGKFVNKP